VVTVGAGAAPIVAAETAKTPGLERHQAMGHDPGL